MSRILVTGGSGFIGRQTLAPLVNAGWDVHAVGHTRTHDVAGVTWHHADLLAPGAGAATVRRVTPTHLLHAAWDLAPGQYLQSPGNLAWVSASLDLLQAFADHGGTRAVVVGTCFEYDLQQGFCREDHTPLAPATVYAACKHGLHVSAAAWARARGVELAWARPFFLYGPHEHPKRLVASVARALLAGERAATSHGRQFRDFLHTGDLGEALGRLAGHSLTGPVNIASGVPVPVGEIVRIVAACAGREDLVDWGAVAVPGDDPPLVVADVRRWHEASGWVPSWSLADGLRETVEWWRRQER